MPRQSTASSPVSTKFGRTPFDLKPSWWEGSTFVDHGLRVARWLDSAAAW